MRSEWYPECYASSRASKSTATSSCGATSDECSPPSRTARSRACNRFFEVLLRLTTPRFVMRCRPPPSWKYVRRGQGMIHVEADDERAICRYVDFPYFDDVNYRLLALGTIRLLASPLRRDEPARRGARLRQGAT